MDLLVGVNLSRSKLVDTVGVQINNIDQINQGIYCLPETSSCIELKCSQFCFLEFS